MKRWIAIVGMLALVAGCSDDSSSTTDGGTVPQADTTSQCGAGIYPCGPYGTAVNSVAQNFEFDGYMDPKNHCTDHDKKVMDTTTLRKISFSDWFLGDSSCAAQKKELLWVVVSAGWCVPCQDEVKAIQQKYAAGGWDKRLGIVNVVFETAPPTIKPADAAFIKQWTDGFKLTMPVVMDPQFKMGAYFDKKNTPFNMFIDLKTMQIYYRNTGSSGTDYAKLVSDFFSKK